MVITVPTWAWGVMMGSVILIVSALAWFVRREVSRIDVRLNSAITHNGFEPLMKAAVGDAIDGLEKVLGTKFGRLHERLDRLGREITDARLETAKEYVTKQDCVIKHQGGE